MICVFCEVLNNKEKILHEFANSFIILDLFPKAKQHLLLISKEHYVSFIDMSKDKFLSIMEELNSFLNEMNFKNYKLEVNNGIKAGQEIKHLHIHIKVY